MEKAGGCGYHPQKYTQAKKNSAGNLSHLRCLERDLDNISYALRSEPEINTNISRKSCFSFGNPALAGEKSREGGKTKGKKMVLKGGLEPP